MYVVFESTVSDAGESLGTHTVFLIWITERVVEFYYRTYYVERARWTKHL
jgi:hypothetical protein